MKKEYDFTKSKPNPYLNSLLPIRIRDHLKDDEIRIDKDLTLRLLTERDSSDFHQLVKKNRDFFSQSGAAISNLVSEEDAAKSVHKRCEEYINNTGVSFAIRLNEALIGIIGIRALDWSNQKCSIGYFLSEEVAGKGIGTKSVVAVVSFCFEMLRLNRIEATTATINKRSIALLEKLGFKREGTLRQHFLVGSHFIDDHAYSLLRSERKGCSGKN